MRQLKNYAIIALGILIAALTMPACKDKPQDIPVDQHLASRYDYRVVFDWNSLFLDLERYAAGYRPGPAPRALAYLGFSAYEACVSGMPEYQSLASRYVGLSLPQVQQEAEYHWPTVVNASYAYLMGKFFKNAAPDRFALIATLENANNLVYKTEISEEVFQRSQKHGRAVAAVMWEWAQTDDAGHDAHLNPFGDYIWQAHYDGPGDWVPTSPGPGKGLFPYWGQVRTFALTESRKRCRPPLPFSENPQTALYTQALEVYVQNTPSLPYESEWIAEYWSDDLLNLTFSPPCRWLAVANQIYANEQCNLEKAIVTNAKLGMALNDAAVGAWYSKYYYNVERPETYIRRVIDPAWHTNLDNPLTGEKGLTPSFPAYPSGHATFGAAGVEAMASEFGYSYSMTDRCHEGRTEFISTPRTFNSLYEMALEDAWSRVLLGVHFRMDAEEGTRFGTEIGRMVNSLPWKK
ncbi:MAG: vanadium-dependent haloperoxidase [Saprospiraceae bacterium]|nr:vanadium-dependent haloperoxidase [Saprospiraceae bacterium]